MIPKFILTIVPFFSRLLPILNYCILLKSAVKLPGDVGSNYFIFVNFREDHHGTYQRQNHQGQQRRARWGWKGHLPGSVALKYIPFYLDLFNTKYFLSRHYWTSRWTPTSRLLWGNSTSLQLRRFSGPCLPQSGLSFNAAFRNLAVCSRDPLWSYEQAQNRHYFY